MEEKDKIMFEKFAKIMDNIKYDKNKVLFKEEMKEFLRDKQIELLTQIVMALQTTLLNKGIITKQELNKCLSEELLDHKEKEDFINNLSKGI